MRTKAELNGCVAKVTMAVAAIAASIDRFELAIDELNRAAARGREKPPWLDYGKQARPMPRLYGLHDRLEMSIRKLEDQQ